MLHVSTTVSYLCECPIGLQLLGDRVWYKRTLNEQHNDSPMETSTLNLLPLTETSNQPLFAMAPHRNDGRATQRSRLPGTQFKFRGNPRNVAENMAPTKSSPRGLTQDDSDVLSVRLAEASIVSNADGWNGMSNHYLSSDD